MKLNKGFKLQDNRRYRLIFPCSGQPLEGWSEILHGIKRACEDLLMPSPGVIIAHWVPSPPYMDFQLRPDADAKEFADRVNDVITQHWPGTKIAGEGQK